MCIGIWPFGPTPVVQLDNRSDVQLANGQLSCIVGHVPTAYHHLSADPYYNTVMLDYGY